MIELNYDILRKIAGAPVNKDVVAGLVQYLPPAMEKYQINTKLRIAHFLGQLCHESDHFRTLQEYASGARYEGRRDLGNVYRGDGRRYKGRGAIQLTGRANYKTIGNKIGVDLVNNPQLAATPKISALTACQFWVDHGLNRLADKDDVKSITKRINGGYNGLSSREGMVLRAKAVLKNMKLVDQPPPEKKDGEQ